MNINEFNDKIVEEGKRIFGDSYSFASSNIDSVMHSHCTTVETRYRATIFLNNGSNFSADSTDIDVLFEKLELKYKELNAKQSDIEL